MGGLCKSQKNGGSFGTVAVESFVIAPTSFMGQWGRADTAYVDEVISDRAFWIKPSQDASDNKRILAIVREDVPSREMIDINAGDTIGFTGLALPADHGSILAGTLDQDAKQAIKDVPAFVTMYWKDIDKAERQTAERQ